MRYGDVAGKGVVYDERGAPELAGGETIRGHAVLRFMVYTGMLDSKPFLLDLYEGTVYLTDRRLVGIRRPDPKKAALARLSYTADMDVLDTAKRAKDVLEQGGFEFFSVPFDEMIRVRKSRLARAVDITVQDRNTGKKVHINIAPEKELRKLFGEANYGLWLEKYCGKK
jgi:hypothetical protein